MGEGKQLIFKLGQPRGFVGQQDATGFETSLLTRHSGLLIVLGPPTNDIDGAVLFQKLDQTHASTGIFDDDQASSPMRCKREDLVSHLQHSPMPAGNVKKMNGLLVE